MKLKHYATLLIGLVLLSFVACTTSNSDAIQSTEELPTDTSTPSPTSTNTMVPTSTPTSVLLPTKTPTPEPSEPIDTPIPANTATIEPSATSTNSPELTITPLTDFDLVARELEVPELGLTVYHPLTWFGAPNLEMGGILLADNFEEFTQGNPNADVIGIFIVVLPEATGPVDEILAFVSRLENITEPVGEIVVEKINDQDFAWTEYSAQSNGNEVHYFITAITDGSRAVAAFTSVYPDRQDEVRPIYRAIVESIELHDIAEGEK